jgi:putative ABC transport system substrate-binding protein
MSRVLKLCGINVVQRTTTPVRIVALATLCVTVVSPCRLPAQDAQADRVLILLGKSYPQYQQVAAGFTEVWKAETGNEPTLVVFPTNEKKKNQLLSSQPTLVVGLGEVPTVWALGRDEEFRLAFSMVVAPQRLEGFAKLLSTKSRRLAGISIEVDPEKQLDLLLTVMPGLKRIGVLTNSVALRPNVSKLAGICEKRGLELNHVELPVLSELPAKLSDLLGRVELVWSLPDPAIFHSESAQHIITQCSERKVPLVGLSATFVKSGATISFDPDYHEVGQLLANQCLIRAAGQAGSLTVASPQTIVVSINERSFRALSLKAELVDSAVRLQRY